MKMHGKIRWSMAVMAALTAGLIALGGAWASEGKIRVGRLVVIPGVAAQGEYDDNIYLGNGDNDTSERKESDWITHIKPSLALKYDMDIRGSISAGYAGDFAWYKDNSDNDWSSHRVALKGDYLAPAGMIVGVQNNYVNADDPYSTDNLYRLGEQTKRWNNDLQTRIGYQFGQQLRLLGYFNLYKQEYDLERDATQNYDEYEFGVGAEMRVMPQTWAFVRLFTGERDYNDHSELFGGLTDNTDAGYSFHRVNVGMNWDATSKISGEFNVGYQWLDADNEFDPRGNPYDDKNTWTAKTRVFYQATPKTRMGVELIRALRFSGADLSEYFDETGFGVNLNQTILTNGVIRAGLGYAIQDYNHPVGVAERSDDNIRALLGFDYYFREWLMAGLEYRYWDRDSDVSAYDFTVNRFMATVGVTY